MGTLMKCGHSANAKDIEGKPVCVICVGIKEGAKEVDIETKIPEGRMAKCSYCNNREHSSVCLPYFKYDKDRLEDSFYCGCRGWD